MNTSQGHLTTLIQAEIRQNNRQMFEAMQKMSDNSVSQLKRSASESAESQLQEIREGREPTRISSSLTPKSLIR